MIANPAIPYPAAVPLSNTLNDLRVHSPVAEAPSSNSARTVSGLALAVVLAIGAFIWLDPLRLLAPTEASPPAPASTPLAEPARPTERQEIVAPLTPVPEAKSVEAPIAAAPVVQAPHAPAPVVRPRAVVVKPASRGDPTDKTNTTVLETAPKEMAAPSPLVIKPEQQTDMPIVPKLGDDTRNAPKPAAAIDQAPVTE